MRSISPIRVGRLWVGPPWETPPTDALVVVVDPGRAFGTGSHQTTQLCLQTLQELEPGPLLDVGCGSGVLSIAAALLGFAPVLGVDIEEPSIEATLENARANGVTVDAKLVAGDEQLPSSPLVVANISLESVEALPARTDADTLDHVGLLRVGAAAAPRLRARQAHHARRVGLRRVPQNLAGDLTGGRRRLQSSR